MITARLEGQTSIKTCTQCQYKTSSIKHKRHDRPSEGMRRGEEVKLWHKFWANYHQYHARQGGLAKKWLHHERKRLEHKGIIIRNVSANSLK